MRRIGFVLFVDNLNQVHRGSIVIVQLPRLGMPGCIRDPLVH